MFDFPCNRDELEVFKNKCADYFDIVLRVNLEIYFVDVDLVLIGERLAGDFVDSLLDCVVFEQL